MTLNVIRVVIEHFSNIASFLPWKEPLVFKLSKRAASWGKIHMPCLYIDCIELQDIFHRRIVSTKALVFFAAFDFLTLGTSGMAHKKEAL